MYSNNSNSNFKRDNFKRNDYRQSPSRTENRDDSRTNYRQNNSYGQRAQTPTVQRNIGGPLTPAGNKLRIVPIGGQGENGRNCWVYEQDNEILIIDAGIGFVPHGIKGGIDLLLPNLEYLINNKQKIKALIISNPHEEFSGSTLKFLNELEIKDLYLPALYYELIKDELSKDININLLEGDSVYKIGNKFSVHALPVSFSCPDSFSFLLEINKLKIFHASAFKIDHSTPIFRFSTDLSQLASVNPDGVDLLISPSVNCENSGYSASESSISKTFETIFEKANSKICLLINNSNMQRLQAIFDSSVITNKTICLCGEELQKWFTVMKKLNYWENIEKVNFCSLEDTKKNKIKNKDLVFVLSETEGEILNALALLTDNTFGDISLEKNDTLIISSNIPLGTTRLCTRMIDELSFRGIKVFTSRDNNIHVNNFGGKEELKFLYNLTRPKYFFPCNGEARQLVLHAELIGSCGIDPKKVLILDNGSILDFDGLNVELKGKIQCSPIFFNKSLEVSMNTKSIEERQILGEDGTILIGLTLDIKNSKIIAGPSIKSSGGGFTESANWKEIEEKISNDIKDCLNKAFTNNQKDLSLYKRLINEIFQRRVREKFGSFNSIVSIVIQDIGANENSSED